MLLCLNLLRSGTGGAWAAIRANETVAEALGIGVAAHKLLAFVISSSLTALAGALFAYTAASSRSRRSPCSCRSNTLP